MYCYTFIFNVRFKLTKFLCSFISLKASSKLTEEQIEGKQIQIFLKNFTFYIYSLHGETVYFRKLIRAQ